MTGPEPTVVGEVAPPRVELLVRKGCSACETAAGALDELGVAWSAVDVDEAAAFSEQGRELRAEHGDRLPVVLLDGREHSWGTVDGPRLQRDLHA